MRNPRDDRDTAYKRACRLLCDWLTSTWQGEEFCEPFGQLWYPIGRQS
jgi:hypothetical protein